MIVIVFEALQLIKSSIKYREKKFKIKSIFGESGLKNYLNNIVLGGGESRIHGNSIKSAYGLKKKFL